MQEQINRTQRAAGAASGQAVILIALLLVGLMAMAGLAVDGGGYFFLERDAQNAADAAVIAAAFSLCTLGDDAAAINAGLQSAEDNRFADGDGSVRVSVNLDPPSYAAGVDGARVIEVIINVDKPSYFIGIVLGDTDLPVRAGAVAECQPARTVVVDDGSSGDDGSGGGGDGDYAFRSLSGPGDCAVGSPSITLAGTGYTVRGDYWAGNIGGNPETGEDRIQIYGDIFVGGPDSTSNNLGADYYNLTEKAADSTSNGFGGDGTPTFNAPEPSGGDDATAITGMDYYRPSAANGGEQWCSDGTGAACGGAIASGTADRYYDISFMCNESPTGKITEQNLRAGDARVNGGTPVVTTSGNVATFASGVYYSTCQLELANFQYRGEVTFILERDIRLNAPPSGQHDFTAYNDEGEQHPLVMTWYPGGMGGATNRSSNCSTQPEGVNINANNTKTSGDVIAWNGQINIDGNGSFYQSCFIGWGIRINGTEGTVVECGSSSTSTPSSPSPPVTVNEPPRIFNRPWQG